MGRKAKDAAQQKIGEWTGARRNVSKSTTKSKNTNASNENRAPLQSHSQSDLNAMKNCSVRLEKLRTDIKATDAVLKTPAKKVPAIASETPTAADVITKDKQADTKNVYDYSFDGDDAPGPMKSADDEMKDLFAKLAKENIIEVKKYRPKNGKKTKPAEKVSGKAVATQKRRREKQPIDVEPPQKKPNLKAKVATATVQKIAAKPPTAPSTIDDIDDENVKNNNVPIKKAILETKQSANINTAIRSDLRKQVNAVNAENVNAQPRLRNRNLQNFQSTPISSTPLGKKANAKSKENDCSLNSMFFASPLTGSARPTRGNVQKQRLQLSAINDSQEDASIEGNQSNENANPTPVVNYMDDDDFDFGNDMVNEPQPNHDNDVDKENSLDRPSTSAAAQNRPSTSSAALRSLDRPGTSASMQSRPGTSSALFGSLDRPSTSSAAQNRPSTSSAASSVWDQPSTSSAAKTPLRTNNDKSIFVIQDESEYNIFSPTKRRVYGRSPLKNITSEVNNTNSPSFESAKSTPRSFGILPKSATNSIQPINSTKGTELTLPEASYFSSRRTGQEFDRNVYDQNFTDDCFGFDDGDDDDDFINETTNNESEPAQTTTKTVSKPETDKCALKDIRSKLKRFLHKPDAEPNESIKKSKANETSSDKNKAKKVKTPMKSPAKTAKSPAKMAKSPAKQKRNIVFADAGAKQKDIRSAFTAKSSDKRKQDNSKEVAVLFEEIHSVQQDRRRSYSRPQRQRKRRMSIESESEDEEQQSDDDFDDDIKTSKRAKRRKKTNEPNPKELEELEEFARQTNEHFAEIDSFEWIKE